MTATVTIPTGARERAAQSRSTQFAGTATLIRLILRRDRVRLSVWTLSLTAFYAYFTFALDTVFADQAAMQGRAAIMSTPAGIVMGGPGYGLDNYTTGVALANESITWAALTLSVFAILHVIRHTRAQEESGQSELVRAAVVGRHAPAVAATLVLGLTQLLIATLGALAMSAAGQLSFVDSLAVTLGSALVALVFGAVALLAAQVSEHARTATGASLAVFGLAFVLRALGDMQGTGGSAVSWLSPIAWAQQTRAFVDLRWWPLLLAVGATVIVTAAAVMLASRRDFGGGLVATRAGRADAHHYLRNPLSMAWRQQRGALVWSSLGLGLLWLGTGSMMPDIEGMISDLVADNPALGDIFGNDGANMAVGFLTVMLLYVALSAAAFGIVMAQRVRAEEEASRGELVLAGPTSRFQWLASQTSVALVGMAVLMAVSTYAMWLGAVTSGWEAQSFGDYSAVLWSYLPALAIHLLLVVAIYGWAPRLTGLAWVLVAYTFVIGMFGSLFELPGWMFRVSPFDWVPEPFSGTSAAGDLALLWGVAAALALVGFVGFRRRDLATQ